MTATSTIWSPGEQRRFSAPDAHLQLFALNATAVLGTAVAQKLGRSLAAHEEREFEDGEHKVRPLDSVSGQDVYVIQGLHGGPDHSPNDKLCRLLFFIGALKDAGASRVTAVVPYLCYARKDRRTKPNDAALPGTGRAQPAQRPVSAAASCAQWTAERRRATRRLLKCPACCRQTNSSKMRRQAGQRQRQCTTEPSSSCATCS